MSYSATIGNNVYRFADLKALLAKATPPRSGDFLAGIAAASQVERIAARLALAELPLLTFLHEALIPYDADEVTRLIVDRHDADAFAAVSHLTVGDFRNWLLLDSTDEAVLARVAPGITPEMAAAVSKLMRNQDLILAANFSESARSRPRRVNRRLRCCLFERPGYARTSPSLPAGLR